MQYLRTFCREQVSPRSQDSLPRPLTQQHSPARCILSQHLNKMRHERICAAGWVLWNCLANHLRLVAAEDEGFGLPVFTFPKNLAYSALELEEEMLCEVARAAHDAFLVVSRRCCHQSSCALSFVRRRHAPRCGLKLFRCLDLEPTIAAKGSKSILSICH